MLARLAARLASRASQLAHPPAALARLAAMASTEEAAAEAEVGIVAFANNAPGFSAVLKHRFSDFLVTELSADGEPALLFQAGLPPPLAAREQPAAAAEPPPPPGPISAGPPPDFDLQACVSHFQPLLSGEDAAALRAWLLAAQAGPPPPPLTLSPLADKAARAALHAAASAHLPWGESDTAGAEGGAGAPREGGRALSVRLHAARGSVLRPRPREPGGRKRARPAAVEAALFGGGGLGPPPPGAHLSFVLCKENVETHAALALLGSLLRVAPRAFGTAGTKDKRGVTCQRVTLPRGQPAALAALNARLCGMRVGNFRYTDAQLGLGQLAGNAFAVTLRDVTADAGACRRALEALARSGFVNYFGLQRFGSSPAARTHVVGAALLRGEWEAAVALIMTSRAGERAEMAAARAAWTERRDAAGALRLLPRGAAAERALMAHFAARGGGAGEALRALLEVPKTLRMMYVHAYQSGLWNRAASARMGLPGGLEAALEGDLVAEAANGEILLGTAVAGDAPGGARVRYVTAEEAARRALPLAAVLLPLPAPGTLLPLHAAGEVYRSQAAADGVSLEGSPHGAREFSLAGFAGGYRPLVTLPGRLAARLLRYDGPDQELTETPLGACLAAEGAARGGGGLPPPQPAPGAPLLAEAEGEGRYTALQVHFTLPASSYATMAVRELLKQSTSAAFHKALSAAAAGKEREGGE